MPIPLLQLLHSVDAGIVAGRCKVHLACWNGKEHPLDEYLGGRFEDWQSWQTQRNFQRPLVISLIQYRAVNRWLFAGVFQSKSCTKRGDLFRYSLTEQESCRRLRGRVLVEFNRTFRNSYPNAETCDAGLVVSQILPEPYSIEDFPGYRRVNITKSELDMIVRLVPDSWQTALSSVAGVYLISDSHAGQLYVGSATGQGGIWQRWVSYSLTGHGGNKLLREVLLANGPPYASNFRFSILEIADIHDTEAALLKREAHWKRVLLTRDHGLNAN